MLGGGAGDGGTAGGTVESDTDVSDMEIASNMSDIEMEDPAAGGEASVPRIELMEADEELWGESAVVHAIKMLVREPNTLTLTDHPTISIEELLKHVPSYLPRAAVDLVLMDLHHNLDWMAAKVHIMYYDGILHVLNSDD